MDDLLLPRLSTCSLKVLFKLLSLLLMQEFPKPSNAGWLVLTSSTFMFAMRPFLTRFLIKSVWNLVAQVQESIFPFSLWSILATPAERFLLAMRATARKLAARAGMTKIILLFCITAPSTICSLELCLLFCSLRLKMAAHSFKSKGTSTPPTCISHGGNCIVASRLS